MSTMYQGWAMLGGEELWNAERTATYVAANLPTIELSGCEDCITLADALGDPPYKNNPVDDDAPWISAEDPDLALFYGFYPLSVSGMTDSTATVTVTESIGDGGTVSAVRRASKEIRVSGMLFAGSQIALNRGKSWLRNISLGPACESGTGCGGADLCFFAACPKDHAQGDEYLRIVRDVSLLQGVTTTREFSPIGAGCAGGSGAYMEQVEFTFVAATPHVYGQIEYLGGTVGSPAANYCANPSADADTSGWSVLAADTLFARDTAQVHSAPGAFRLTSTGPGDSIYGASMYTGASSVALAAGTNLRWSVWIKANRAGTAHVTPTLNAAWLPTVGQRAISVTTSWQQVVIDHTAAAAVDTLGFVVGTKDVGITLWFDDVFFGANTTGALTLDPTAPELPDCNNPPGVGTITDPTVPMVPMAPRPPPVTTNLKPTQPWASGYSLFIPKTEVPETGNAVLVISLTTGSEAARYIRLRLYPAPLGFEQKVSDLDACSNCAEIVVMYIPPNSTFRIDGMNQTLSIIDPIGNAFPASHLAYSGVGLPTGWAAMTCGIDYWLSVEFPGEADPTNKFITGALKDSSTFNVDLGSWQNGPNEDGSPRATLVRDTGAGNYHSGPGGMRVSWPQGSTDRPQVLLTGLTPGLTYELGAWMKTPTTPIRLDMGPGMSGTQSAVGAAWQYVSINATATGTQHMVRLSNTTTNPSGNCYFDEFVLHDITTARYSVTRLDVATARRM